ncbi:hypothetical protein F5884DRAFT_745213 [Xylogone sp. PMI_703]|nr:hypothetical protein F5884DRAFT_745213 [Xylogone sp. PMI_703]
MSSSDFALLGDYPPTKYNGTGMLKRMVQFYAREVNEGRYEHEYFAISEVTQERFESIKKRRGELGHPVRLMYFPDIETMIVKLVTKAHEKAHLKLGYSIARRVARMELLEEEFTPLGATLYKSPEGSQKEGDSSFINELIWSGSDDWPSLVIEAGYSESLKRLRANAKWWIVSSGAQVQIVLLITVAPTTKQVLIEKWIPHPVTAGRPATQSRRLYQPHLDSTIAINQAASLSVITGAPLILEFAKVFCRPPNSPQELDIVFMQEDLDRWASSLWVGL